jgi:hypothetical protein
LTGPWTAQTNKDGSKTMKYSSCFSNVLNTEGITGVSPFYWTVHT